MRNGRVWSDQQGKGKKDESKETVELAATVKVTIDQAIKTASGYVPGKAVEDAEHEQRPVCPLTASIVCYNTLVIFLIDESS
ncbi:MAG: hypothetical protein ACXW4A_06370 [Nitrospira sp.]